MAAAFPSLPHPICRSRSLCTEAKLNVQPPQTRLVDANGNSFLQQRRFFAGTARVAGGRGQPGRGGLARASANAERALRTTVELDKLIDRLRVADGNEVAQIIAENIFAFDQSFWLRLATRADTCTSADDRRDLEELSVAVMGLVDRMVRCTEERMDSTSDKLAELLVAAAVVDNGQFGDEIVWPPQDPLTIQRLREEISRRDEAGQLDDSFLASLTAQLRQAVEKGDRPGLVAMLQKVLQLYAGVRFGKRSYAMKEDGSVDEAEKLLESIILGEVEDWDARLREGLALGGGSVSGDAFAAALELRGQRMLMRTESGSYEQRILGEYLAELEQRAKSVVEAFNTA